jgi:hypothetical protein
MLKRSPMNRTGVLRIASHDITERKTRTRKCATCREPFAPRNMTHKVCCAACGLALAEKNRTAANRAETRKRLAALKSRASHLKDAQAAFNKFIRARDAELPCVSCGRFHTGAWDAGHYKSVGAMPALRFVEINVHRQCVPCNQYKSGNVIEYRIGLVKRIGVLSVEWLEQDHPAKKYTILEAQAIKATYKQKLKELQA